MLVEINKFVEPILAIEVEELRNCYPGFRCKYGSAKTTSNGGQIWFIDCWHENSVLPEPNCISLVVGVKNISTYPELCTFDVCWGGDGNGENLAETIDLIDNAIPWGDVAMNTISAGIPKLMDNLKKCLSIWSAKFIVGNA